MTYSKTLILTLGLLSSSIAMADEPQSDWSFSEVGAYQAVADKTASLFAWAEAEYAEHDDEGLFKRYPEDGKVIKATLDLAKNLKTQSKQAAAKGDQTTANALLFAAEAIAFYSTKMPHLLEKRIASQTQVSNE